MPTVLIPIAMLSFAFQATAQEMPRLLFCTGQCFGVDKNGDRIPVTKGTELAPGLRLETGPNSYAQVKFGPDNACGIGENARVRFESRPGERDVVFLDQGRIRMIGGELIGRPGTPPVELRTVEGTIVLRSADIEVKTLPKSVDAQPALTLVKLNVGDARLGDLPVSRDGVQGIAGGKILDRAIPIGDIALPTLVREPAPSGPGGVTERAERPPFLTLPVVGLPVAELKPITEAVLLSPAIVSQTLPVLTTSTTTTFSGQLSTTSYNFTRTFDTTAYVPKSMLVTAYGDVQLTSGTRLSLDNFNASLTGSSSTTLSPELSKTFTLQTSPSLFILQQ
jgi:hypothetical protein